MNSIQQQILLGSLLGDGCLAMPEGNKHPRYQEAHSIKQDEYLLWKFEQLNGLGKATLKEQTFINHGKAYTRVMMYIGVNSEFDELYKEFYPEGKKVIPKNLIHLLTPLSLAVWYMDDGSYSHRNKTARIATYGYNEEDRHLILEVLKNNFGLRAKSYASKVTAFGVRQTVDLFDIIREHIHPSLGYKINYLSSSER